MLAAFVGFGLAAHESIIHVQASVSHSSSSNFYLSLERNQNKLFTQTINSRLQDHTNKDYNKKSSRYNRLLKDDDLDSICRDLEIELNSTYQARSKKEKHGTNYTTRLILKFPVFAPLVWFCDSVCIYIYR